MSRKAVTASCIINIKEYKLSRSKLTHRAGTKWRIIKQVSDSNGCYWHAMHIDIRILDNKGRWDDLSKSALRWEPLNKFKAVWSTFEAYSISTALVSLIMGFSLRFPHWSRQMTTAWAVKTLFFCLVNLWNLQVGVCRGECIPYLSGWPPLYENMKLGILPGAYGVLILKRR